jgi:hypothetical protein
VRIQWFLVMQELKRCLLHTCINMYQLSLLHGFERYGSAFWLIQSLTPAENARSDGQTTQIMCIAMFACVVPSFTPV